MKRIFVLLFLFVPPATASSVQVHKDCFIQPCEIKGDFDGDKKMDVAVLVSNSSGKKGIQVTFADRKTALVGAGQLFGNGGDSFDWMDHWSLHKGNIKKGADEPAPPKPKGDSLLLEKTESASGLVYWNGSGLRWYQQGD